MDGTGFLDVYRDRYGSYEQVGRILADETGDGPRFAYDPLYLASGSPMSVSLSLPLQERPCDPQVTYAFFEGLLAEGDPRKALARSIHADEGSFEDMLARFDYESAGYLVFSEDGRHPRPEEMGYRAVDGAFFPQFAATPSASMVRQARRARVSIAGSMNKIGLYRDPLSGGWFQPVGGAPTTHIVKAPDPSFPNQVENEALCLKAAARCGLPAAECEVLGTPAGNLLAVRRFDRAFDLESPSSNGPGNLPGERERASERPLLADGHPVPRRIHQEDLCQAIGCAGFMKYEEHAAAFLPEVLALLRAHSGDPVRDMELLMDYLAFDYLVGNCDNHLKNFALVYPGNRRFPTFGPLYDVLHCPGYDVDLDMGFPLSAQRGVYGLDAGGLRERCRLASYSAKRALEKFEALYAKLPDALEAAEAELLDAGMDSRASLRAPILAHAKRIMDGLRRQ